MPASFGYHLALGRKRKGSARPEAPERNPYIYKKKKPVGTQTTIY